MKLTSFLTALFLGTSPVSALAMGDILITCKGNVGPTPVSQVLTFGGNNPSVQDFAVSNGSVYSIELASYSGFIDILMLEYVYDSNGTKSLNEYYRSHGGTALDLVSASRHINVTCTMSGP